VFCPLCFLAAVKRVRRLFDVNPDYELNLSALRNCGAPSAACIAAAAALVNDGVLQWTDDGTLVRADVPLTITRRTA
jgi:predicted pyridoxine 5'-phosphate oxidase superfamily flavin-nucleotide-binding protein